MGQFFFNTPLGWQIYIGILVLWLGGCQIGLTIMNRIILWSGYLQENYTAHTKLMSLIANDKHKDHFKAIQYFLKMRGSILDSGMSKNMRYIHKPPVGSSILNT